MPDAHRSGHADPALRRSDRADYQAQRRARACASSSAARPRHRRQDRGAALDLARRRRERGDRRGRLRSTSRPRRRLPLPRGRRGRRRRARSASPRPARARDRGDRLLLAQRRQGRMHVGHLRSTILGDALACACSRPWATASSARNPPRRLGHAVRHAPRAPCRCRYPNLRLAAGARHRRRRRCRRYRARPSSVGDLNAFYQEARRKFDADPAFADRARRRVVLLQGGDEPTLALWRRFVAESRRLPRRRVREAQGVTLTDADIAGESFYNPHARRRRGRPRGPGPGPRERRRALRLPRGLHGPRRRAAPALSSASRTAATVTPRPPTSPPCASRQRGHAAARAGLVYVVGSPQSQHLAMVFAVGRRASRLAGRARAGGARRPSAAVPGPRTRRCSRPALGETVRLVALLDEAVQRARDVIAEKNPELDAATREDVARAVGIGAMKYADLSSDRASRTTSSIGSECSRSKAIPLRTSSTPTRASSRSSAALVILESARKRSPPIGRPTPCRRHRDRRARRAGARARAPAASARRCTRWPTRSSPTGCAPTCSRSPPRSRPSTSSAPCSRPRPTTSAPRASRSPA